MSRCIIFFFLLGSALGAGPTSAETWSARSDFELVYLAQQYGVAGKAREDKMAAQEELRRRGASGLRAIMEFVHLENVMIKVFGQQLVQELPADVVIPVLLEYVESPHTKTRKMAAWYCGFHEGVEGDAQPLYALLKDEEAVGATIRALGKWKLVGAIDQITPFANHEKETWRVAVANALRDIGDFKGVPTLLNQLNDSFFTVRKAAARALVHLAVETGGQVTVLPNSFSTFGQHELEWVDEQIQKLGGKAISTEPGDTGINY